MVNANPTTGVRYGYISANSLHPDMLMDIMMNGTNESFEDYCLEIRARIRRALDNYFSKRDLDQLCDYAVDELAGDNFMCDEQIISFDFDGVKGRTSWLGGALNVWIFESPVVGNYAECSPCVPGAGNLDCPDLAGVVCYDVPKEWRNG